MASVMVWCASGLSEPSDMADAMKRLHDGRRGFHLVQRQRRRSRTNFQQVTQHGGFVLGRLGTEGVPGLMQAKGRPRRTAGAFPSRSAEPLRFAAASCAARRDRLCGSEPSRSREALWLPAARPAPGQWPWAAAIPDAWHSPARVGCPLPGPQTKRSRNAASSPAKPMPEMGDGVPSKQSSTTSRSRPSMSKRWAPR